MKLLAKFEKILYMGFRATFVPFLNYKPLKLQFRVFLGGHTVAIVTYWVTKMITTCSPMIGQCFDTMFVASSDKE